jgi:hypothetical protein
LIAGSDISPGDFWLGRFSAEPGSRCRFGATLKPDQALAETVALETRPGRVDPTDVA